MSASRTAKNGGAFAIPLFKVIIQVYEVLRIRNIASLMEFRGIEFIHY
jgi:hypothetical protein